MSLNRLKAAIAIAVALLSCLACSPVSAEQPDMVIYLSDDHSQFDSSLYGAADIPTPNFEQLARDGMMFTHAFVASPSCAPSRGAMLTGRMPARNGAEANHTFPRPNVPSLVENMKALGYEVASFGKVAHGRGGQFGFDVVKPGKSYSALRTDVAKYLASRKSDKPLCLFVGISNPHVPWPEESSFDPDEVVFPPHHIDTPATRKHRASYYEEIKEVDLLLGELREMAATHLGENVLFLHTSDHGSQWPFGKWNLYDYGTRVPFLVAMPGVVEPGTTSDAMVSWVDILPTLIDIAGGEQPKGLDGRSILPVLKGETDTHRERIFVTHSGDGNMNIYPIRCVRTREWKLIHNLHPEFAHTNHSDLLRKQGAGAYWAEWAERAKTDPEAKAIVDRYFQRPEFELYHVSQDKWELNNVIDEPEQAEWVAQLKQELAAWMEEQGDQQTVFNEPRPLAKPETWRPDFHEQRLGE